MVDIYCFIVKCILETGFGRYVWYLKLYWEVGGKGLGKSVCSK